jgi:hypothetical protein
MTNKSHVLQMLEDQKQQAKVDVSHPDEIKREWISAIEELYASIQGWLKDAVSKGLITIETSEVPLNEKILHFYNAPTLQIVTPRGQTIEIVPKGRFVVGASGRLDLRCGVRVRMIIRTEEGRWRFTDPASPAGWKHEAVTEESFWEAIGEFIGAGAK